ncbi:MAG TPA: hypothetical protein VMV61_15125, partial [Patescibacteria group bacterium]|nr:hypothetical protein [Patescibacteria group bacterium]
YDWTKDPQEAANLAETEEGRAVVAGMMRCMQDHFALIRQPDCGLPAAELNPRASVPPTPRAAAAQPPPGVGRSDAGLGQGPR